MSTLHYKRNNHATSFQQEKNRKRRYSEDEDMTEASTTATSSYNIKKKVSKSIKSETKRHKNGIQKKSIRGALLETMDKEALLNILSSLIQKQPELQQEVMNSIPAPTISSALHVLADMEKKFYNSFPFNKNGPAKDDYTFSRVREHLGELIDTITQYANHFTSDQVFPTTSFNFLDYVTHIAHRLPNWDSEKNNTLKRDLYHDLNEFWKQSIQNTSSKLLRYSNTCSSESVGQWAKSLAQHNSFTLGYCFTEAVFEFTEQLGYLIGLPDVNNNTNDATNNNLEQGSSMITSPVLCHLTPLEKTSLASSFVIGDGR